ncbi:hypothetical protein [Sagittula sp. SSi028]|uniref:hypothetical protein n=1 Tax=Sagittula sp. SSi028 TaxID=3400636 RepID=UPI003AF74784
MIFDEVDITKLPTNREEAFARYEAKIRIAFEQRRSNDREYNVDHNGNYEGFFEPERDYVNSILAFLDEYGLDTQLPDISELGDPEFIQRFNAFRSKVGYLTTRYALRAERFENGDAGTVIAIGQDYKSQIGEHLSKIRKIVNSEVKEGFKRDSIFKKVSSLQSEVDRDQTTIDAAFGRMIDLTQALGSAAENLKPAIDQLERVKEIFFGHSKRTDQLAAPNRPKQIEDKSQEGLDAPNTDDEIPF